MIRLSDGTGEWRQLLLDVQEIIDWLTRADQELSSQQPIGGDLNTVQQQNENHQVRRADFFFGGGHFHVNLYGTCRFSGYHFSA